MEVGLDMDARLVALGSHGDVLPMIALGVELRRRGHSVTLASAPQFGPLIERAGLGPGLITSS